MDATHTADGKLNAITGNLSSEGGDGERPITSGLARRLAAAADGYRNGRKIWFIARYVPIDGDYDISDAIESDARPLQPDDPAMGVFGPYLNDSEPIKRTPVIRVTLHLAGGEAREFDASRYDAVIWSSSALRKFALPHYVESAGLDFARKLQADFASDDAEAFVHAPNTEYEIVTTNEGAKHFLIVA